MIERYELAAERIRQIPEEESVRLPFRMYFKKVSEFVLMLAELREKIEDGSYMELSMEQLKEWNQRLYEDILPENYGTSYGNPAYAVEQFGEEYGQILSFLYTELRGGIAYVFEGKTEYLTILMELFIEVYNCFEVSGGVDELKDMIYWYASDYCDVFAADRILEQIDPDLDFAVRIIREADLTDLRYLYRFGEYVSENELRTAEHLLELDESVIQKMADVYTEGYRIGFVNTGKDLSKKSVVNIRYVLGFEPVIRKAIENFEKMGLRPAIYRAGVSVLTKHRQSRVGYYGGVPNPQYDYDHRDDQGLFLNKRFVERKLEVMKHVYETHKDLAAQFAGPALIEVFGEKPFIPQVKAEAIHLAEKQEELLRSFTSKSGQMTNEYIKGEERSFTIVAYPIPEIGPDYEKIFDEVIRINTLDAAVYGRVQQTLIDALDQGEAVRILGKGENRTDLTVQLHPLNDPEKETVFENCVADVNIPVGEVFTSPVLEGTNGKLHVTRVYLGDLQFLDLEIDFSNGMIADYRCGNFPREADGRKYIADNILHNHPTLALGEFAIGTNTTAYVAARRFGIEDKLPILIAEKTGPHFAVGDTCYSWSEDIKVYNPNGKEIVARDNSVSIQRKEDVSKAYYNCHTDITIPYDELGSIRVLKKDGGEILLIENGRFVLPGTELLNEPLDAAGE
ncbi:MAG: aminopeptidase [Eubacteriales bacterium]|nr:aminopeptidase [Eubacteriales bacterium]